MFLNPKFTDIWHGGDYSPEQWTPDVWEEDVRLMQLARCQVATMGMFSWVSFEPEEGKYDFSWLDRSIELLERGDRWFILATPSAAPPAWLSRKYPETLRTGPDRTRRLHGNRVNFSLGSKVYRDKTREAAQALAERYGKHPRLLAWHMSNEYGGADYGPESTAAFRQWLRRKFNGDLDALNRAWWSAFWSHTYTEWDLIEPPGEPYGETSVHGLTVDWKRFVTDQTIDFMLNEMAPLRELTPEVPVTTNLMGTYEGLDYRKLAPHVDFISWDSYPGFSLKITDPDLWAGTSFNHNLMRGLKPDRPWLLMESTPSSANWYPVMQLKPPGLHRFECLHAMAHGADGVQYFQWRQSRGGFEQYHGAVVSHSGAENTRVFQEVREVGIELEGLRGVTGSVIPSEAAVLFDWENRWALDSACGPIRGDKRYAETCVEHHRALAKAGVNVDVIGQDDDVDRYKLLVAPMAYSLRPGFVSAVQQFVRNGGIFLTTYLSGWVDENSLVFNGGFLAPWADLLGIRSEEMSPLFSDQTNQLVMEPGNELGIEGRFAARDFCELIHPKTATVLGTYGSDFYAGRAALTGNAYGKGAAYYAAARLERGFLAQLMAALVQKAGIERVVAHPLPEGVTAIRRVGKRGEHIFLLNSSAAAVSVSTPDRGEVKLAPFDVMHLTREEALVQT